MRRSASPSLRNMLRLAPVALAALMIVSCEEDVEESAAPAPEAIETAAGGPLVNLSGAKAMRASGTLAGDYLAARHAETRQDLAGAADFYMRVLTRDPDNIKLKKTAVLLLIGDGRGDEAAELARDIVEADESFAVANLYLAVSAVRGGDFARAEGYLENLPERGLSEVVQPMVLAWARSGQEKHEAALAALEPLSSKRGFETFYHLHAALMQDFAGNAAAAEKNYIKALGDDERPPARLIQAVASFYHRAERMDEARAILEQYIANNPDSRLLEEAATRLDEHGRITPLIESAGDGIAEALFDISSAFYRESGFRTALVYGNLALLMRPDFPVAQMLLAEILETQERHAQAKDLFAKIRQDSPFYWPARLRIASNLHALGQTDDAISEFETIAGARPENPDSLIDMGDILRSEERYEEAIEAYDRAFQRIPEVRDHHWSLLYSRGIALERAKKWPRAEKDFLRALELQPDQPYVLNYLGYTWVERGEQIERAQDMIETAVARRPNDGFIVDSLGWVFYRVGRYDEAVRHLERAVELRPQDPVINDHLGDAYWQVGRQHEARFQWSRALSLEPEKDLVPTIEAKLQDGLKASSKQPDQNN